MDIVCLTCGAKDSVPMKKPKSEWVNVNGEYYGSDEVNDHPLVQKMRREGMFTSRTLGFLGNEDVRHAMKSAVTEVMGEDATDTISKNMWTEPKISIDMPEKT